MERPTGAEHLGPRRRGARLAGLALLVMLLGGAPLTWARRSDPPRVLVLGFDGRPAGRSFVEILKVQMAASGGQVVQVSLREPSGALAARVARASRQVAAQRAQLAVWIERPGGPGGDHLLLCMVGRRQGQLLVEVKPVPRQNERVGRPELDRALALKVREVLDLLLEERRGSPALARALGPPVPPQAPAATIATASGRPPPELAPVAPAPAAPAEPAAPAALLAPAPVVAPPPATAATDPAPRRRWVPLIAEVGASGATPSGSAGAQAALTAVLGSGLELRGPSGVFELAAVAEVRWPTPLGATRDLRQVNAQEVVLTGGLRAVRLLGPGPPSARPGLARATGRFWLGLELAAGARLLSAQGMVMGRSEGTASLVRAVLVPAVDGRLQLARWAQLRAALGPEVTLVRQQFSLRGTPLFDLGQVRFLGQLLLVLSVP